MLGRKERIHNQVAELIPWFVNDSLTGRTRDKVINHLLGCETCRDSRDRQQRLMALLQDDPCVPDYSAPFNRLAHRIEMSEREKSVLEEIAPASGSWLRRHDWRGPPLSTMAVLALFAVAMVMSPVLQDTLGPADQQFRTLTTNRPQIGEFQRRVLIGFAADGKGELVRKVLVTVNATIVGNPDESGRYVIDLRIPTDRDAHEFIETIRAMQGVRELTLLDSAEYPHDQ